MRHTFGAAFATGETNLDLMRLGGALLVLFSHAWVLTGHADAEPFARLMGHVTDGGGLAVAMFFVISGFLIARSALVHTIPDYLWARALRIYPAFAVVVVLQTIVLGAAISSLAAADYLGSPSTWRSLAWTLVFGPRRDLPGVFETNPYPFVVNGSLWTLRVEIYGYALLLGCAVLGLLRRGRVMLVVGVGFVALTVVGDPITDVLLHFAMGAACWCYRDAIPRRGWIAAVGIAALVLAGWAGPSTLLFHLVLPYLVLWLGLSAPVAAGLLRRTGDISYGTYLCAFPIQQALVALLGPGMGPLGLITMATPLALACGALSRRFVERPALRLRPRRRVAQAPAKCYAAAANSPLATRQDGPA